MTRNFTKAVMGFGGVCLAGLTYLFFDSEKKHQQAESELAKKVKELSLNQDFMRSDLNKVTGVYDNVTGRIQDISEVTVDRHIVESAMRKAADEACSAAARGAIAVYRAEIEKQAGAWRKEHDSELGELLTKKALESVDISAISRSVEKKTLEAMLRKAMNTANTIGSDKNALKAAVLADLLGGN